MVDIIRKKKKWGAKRLMTIGGVLALVLLIFSAFYFTRGGNKLNVDADRITVSDVIKDKFQETIPENGTVMPMHTLYINTVDGGTVEERYVEDGAILKKGDPILKLSNVDVEYNMANQANTVSTALAQVQLAKVNAAEATVSIMNTLADVMQQFKDAEVIYDVDKKLYAQHVIGSQEYQTAVNNYTYLEQKKDLEQEMLHQDSLNRQQEEVQDSESYARAQETLKIMQQKVDQLVIRAPIDGQLTSLDAEVGQNKTPGYQLAQIDQIGSWKVELTDVDEHYLNRIFTGQTGTFDFNDTTYTLKIVKVYSQVLNARFQVDMYFTGKVPTGLRKGQTLQITLALSDVRSAILVPRGGFYQQTGGNWIFKLSPDGKTAYRTDIQLGQQNIDYYEVLSGLKPGDKVVTSSYENYTNMQELVIKK